MNNVGSHYLNGASVQVLSICNPLKWLPENCYALCTLVPFHLGPKSLGDKPERHKCCR